MRPQAFLISKMVKKRNTSFYNVGFTGGQSNARAVFALKARKQADLDNIRQNQKLFFKNILNRADVGKHSFYELNTSSKSNPCISWLTKKDVFIHA